MNESYDEDASQNVILTLLRTGIKHSRSSETPLADRTAVEANYSSETANIYQVANVRYNASKLEGRVWVENTPAEIGLPPPSMILFPPRDYLSPPE